MILKTYELKEVYYCASPDENFEITLDSPALQIFTDFKKHEPLGIEESTNVVEAEDMMKKTHVKLNLVFNENEFVGTLAYSDLIGEKMMSLSHHTPRNQITVGDVMTRKNQLKAIRFSDLKRARVRDVVETLKNEGKQHFLVLDDTSGSIRGVISSSDIARRLHVPLDINKVSTFMDIYKALNYDRF
ncbi:CBS domain-containing protein [Legionella jordanis]|uniref:CBS domain protein n=1 Tax=Legionella jordanis TaxID=456 RepID=A0A0W0VBA6_9GAMM|nr:CBS domain-containing protein [Legionella jordanis]KTD17379.1 CBS domain protein [Legionella jordanis]RMX01854.1 CBS domain-containing protein [Legionella jordanis]RMX17644.1 CBS domain-containing protein [Legionella jordanis]VEH11601.1 CBS domain [Legionella jordanis]HAT8714674.1 CBS domain-containing protein [Legionella jordanis]